MHKFTQGVRIASAALATATLAVTAVYAPH